MVVKKNSVDLKSLDLAYLALFVGQKVNELVLDRMKKAGLSATRESYGYLIQHLVSSERSITELAERMGVTQQAASKMVSELIELGVVEASPAADRRAKTIQLSKRGRESVERTRKIRAEIDRRLEKALGKKAYGRSKERLIACLEELGGVGRIRARRVRQPS